MCAMLRVNVRKMSAGYVFPSGYISVLQHSGMPCIRAEGKRAFKDFFHSFKDALLLVSTSHRSDRGQS